MFKRSYEAMADVLRHQLQTFPQPASEMQRTTQRQTARELRATLKAIEDE